MNSARENTFVPLTATAPAIQSQEFRVGMSAQAGNAQSFRPLGEPAKGISSGTHGSTCEPRVTVQRVGDRVTAIQVQCGCGQIVELACVYDPAPTDP
jgi:hypothetical protein